MAETEYVFLRGNGLPQAWEQREDFTIIETGFGTGLNFLATWKAWRETQPKTSKLRFYTIEAFPLTAKQITDSLKYFTELETYLSCFALFTLNQQLTATIFFSMKGVWRSPYA